MTKASILRALGCTIALGLMLADLAHAQVETVNFSDAEINRIRALGPWPPESKPDPSNRMSGNPKAIAFGKALFHDTRLSRQGKLACASCHQVERGFSNGQPLALGTQMGERNTLALHNLRFQRWFGWGGANDNLWAQSLRPILDEKEMAGSSATVAATVRQQADLRARYTKVFAAPPGRDDVLIVVNLGKALAAYQETLVTPRTTFDQFRDALVAGDRQGMQAYPANAQRGLMTFIGKGRCIMCHSGAQFSNGEFHDVGIPYFVASGGVDTGRYGGIQHLKQSPYTLLGAYNDDPSRSTAMPTRHVALSQRNFGEFKVPSLRNVARTAPYMHNGSLATLRDVILHYSELNEERLHADGERILVPLHLSEQEIADLLAFLESLSVPESSLKPAR